MANNKFNPANIYQLSAYPEPDRYNWDDIRVWNIYASLTNVDSWTSPSDELHGMHIRVQGGKTERGFRTYGWDIRYDNVTGIYDCERMMRLYKVVERSIARWHAKYGYVENFGQWLAIVCETLGFAEVYVKSDRWSGSDALSPYDAAGRIESSMRRDVESQKTESA